MWYLVSVLCNHLIGKEVMPASKVFKGTVVCFTALRFGMLIGQDDKDERKD